MPEREFVDVFVCFRPNLNLLLTLYKVLVWCVCVDLTILNIGSIFKFFHIVTRFPGRRVPASGV